MEVERQRWAAHKVDGPAPSSAEPEVQRTLAHKNKEALEAIRRSLSNKLVNPLPPSRVVESMRASGSCGSLDILLLQDSGSSLVAKTAAPAVAELKASVGGTSKSSENVSSSFEEARANLQDLLLLGRPPAQVGAAMKRQAPLPPPEPDSTELPAVGVEESPADEEEEKPASTVEAVSPTESVPNSSETYTSQTPKLTPAIR